MFTTVMTHRRLKKGRVFYRYLLSYVPILLIPVFMSIFVFDRGQTIIEKEAGRANDLLLSQMNSYLDMVMTDAQQLYLLVSYNSRVASMLHQSGPLGSDEYYRAYLIAKDFNVYSVASETIVEFYVYLPRVDLIISPYGIFSSRNYHRFWMGKVARERRLTYEKWMDQFSFTRQTVYSRSVTETEEEQVVDTISMITPLPVAGQTAVPKGWAVIHIDLDYFQSVFENTIWSDEGLLLVYHNEFGIIATSGPEISNEHLERAKSEALGKKDGEIIRFQGRPYILLSRESDIVNWNYVSLVPADIYADQFNQLTRVTIMAFVVVIGLGGLLIYRFSVARYRPVHDLLALVKPDTEGTISLKSDEFGLIADSLEVTLEEGQRLRQEVRRSEDFLVQRYLKQLLTGDGSDAAQVVKQLATYGIRFDRPFLALVLVDIELDEFADISTHELALDGILELGSGGDVQIIQDLDGTYGFLFNRSSLALGDLVTLLTEKKRMFESENAAHLAIGISRVHEADGPANTLLKEAKKALEFRLVVGRQRPILFDDLAEGESSYYYPIEIENKLINSIKAGDAGKALGILEDIYGENFGGKPLPLEIARCLMFDLISTMIKTINSIVARDEDSVFWSRIKPISRLMACRSFEQLHIEMDDILEQVCDYVIHGRSGRSDRLKSEVLEYIDANFADKNLSPDQIADHFLRNKAYLSRYFKERTGMGLSTYIKRCRVEQAKRALAEGTSTVNDVADHVGFSNSNAFIRAFKEFEGITPGQYKEATYA